ncbi:putative ABC transporter permease protein [Nostocoides japonicum T1-X7]|uniref:Putative ABC transporter permease protein n=1 Tax=Nostocoides japonicum T1-X7 TaxID=1194083 RepID=A0A077LTQ7_9MICO|nr:ABC transporter permease [Tetrasphaera japonica]CCH76701.1 putative ABC transporter permease protein [Tetrasphaera japonica T1-X7]
MSTATIDLTHRPPAKGGGFNTTLLRLEIRRLLRNKRTMLFTVLLPVAFYLIFGQTIKPSDQSLGPGTHGNVSAFIMISMALYGACLATTSGGSTVSVERAQGWSRQLRLTPLSPLAYVVTKALTAMTLGLMSVIAVYIIGAVTGKADMPLWAWIATAATVWVGSLMFAVYGLFMGYLLPTENVMQLLSFTLVIFAFAGGLFLDLSQTAHWYQTLAKFTPMWGLNELVHVPITGGFQWLSLVNALVWLGLFTAGAVWRFRKDTARV